VSSRFNLDLIRGLALKRKAQPSSHGPAGGVLSRRSFLTLSGAGAVLGAVPPFFRGDGFSLLREGARLHLMVGDERRWTIDPAVFGEHAEVSVVHSEHEITIALHRGFYPGTSLPADFVCRLSKQVGVWMLRLTMDCGIEVSSTLLGWLDGKTAATGSWSIHRFSPFDALSIAFQSTPTVVFTPGWTFAIAANSLVMLRGLKQALPASRFELVLNSGSSISAIPDGRSTTVVVPRCDSEWAIDLSRQDERGWRLDHDDAESLFDELHVESAYTDGRTLRSALLMQSAENSRALNFQPGGTLSTDSGEPFTMSLQNPRLAFSLDHDPQSSLIADLSEEPVWAHDTDVSYLFGVSVEAPHFEFHESPEASSAPQISPGICEICFPNDSVCMNLKLGIPRPVPFTWADFIAPFEQFMGFLHLVPTRDENHKLIFDLQLGDCLCIDRPTDLLSLQFEFENMRLVTGVRPRIIHAAGAGVAKVKVIFPPQHVAEEAFFHTDDPNSSGIPGVTKVDVPVGNVELNDYDDPSVTTVNQLKCILDKDYSTNGTALDGTPGARLSGNTRLAFSFRDPQFEIPCDTEGLLDWTDWIPEVVAVAKSNVDTSNLAKLPQITEPDQFTTSIEIPYRLNLSPSELGRWSHSTEAVESKEHIVELWHTRLGVKPAKPSAKGKGPRNPVDEANSKDRTVRATWTPGLLPVTAPSCQPGPDKFPAHYTPADPITDDSPFRMSLDIRDRWELVNLTSNYAITQQASFCPTNNSPLPAQPLLPPTPVQINRMMLTAMGGYLEAFGQWNPCKVDGSHQLTLQMWEHIATLGRDHYVKIVYKGYLAPFGLRASLVKVTQRYFELNADNNWVAILHQHMYVVVKNERKQCPILGQPFGGRAFPFSYVEPVTLMTPLLSDPAKQPWPREGDNANDQCQSLFWPMVPVPQQPNTPPPHPGTTQSSAPFSFRLRFTDITGVHSAESSMPLLFVASDVAQVDGYGTPAGPGRPAAYASQDAVYFYNRGSVAPAPNTDDPWLTASFAGQKFSFAQSTNPGDTDFETDRIVWRAAPIATAVVGTVVHDVDDTPIPNVTVTLTDIVSHALFSVVTNQSGSFSIPIKANSYFLALTSPQAGGSSVLLNLPITLEFKSNTTATLGIRLNANATAFAKLPSFTNGPTPIDLYHYDLPFFYPSVDYAYITSTSIKRITGQNTATKFVFFPTYLSDGFNTTTNSGEALLQKHPDDSLSLAFGGANKSVDKAGGLASPDTLVVGFSRKAGVIGGKMGTGTSAAASRTSNPVITSVSTFSSGKFDPADFFGGLTSAKLLGAVKLSDIIAALAPDLASNLAKAPQMLEQALYDAAAFLHASASQIASFQGLPNNPLATCLSAHAQQVATADAGLTSAQGAGNAIAEGIAEGQLFARIADYIAGLQSALANPLSLIEDAVLQALTSTVQNTITTYSPMIVTQFQNLADVITASLDQKIQDVLQALEPLQVALNSTVDDAMTKGLQLTNSVNADQKQLVSTLAPDLNNVMAIVKLVNDLNGKVKTLSGSLTSLKSNPSSFQQVPQILAESNDVLDDIQQIYNKAGFLAVIIHKAAVGSTLAGTIANVRKNLIALWTIDYIPFAAQIAALHDDCVVLASIYDQTKAQEILQNLRQLKNSVTKADYYGKKAIPGVVLDQDLYRRLQLLQKMQAHILRALVALQALVTETLPDDLSAPVLASVTPVVARILPSVQSLADSLTVSHALLDTSVGTGKAIELQLAMLTGDPDVAKPTKASTGDIYQQLVSVRAQLAKDPLNVVLKLLHYNLSIDYQRPLATALAYLAYIQPTDALKQLVNLLAPVEQLANTIQSALCAISAAWAQFRTSLQTFNGSQNAPLGPIIDSLFGADLDAITATFTTLCNSSQSTPSEYLRNSQSVIAAFVALEKDVRAKISSLPAAAVVDALKEAALNLLTKLLAETPIPTSVNLSYTWQPNIQSCEPVFILNNNASFKVIASAQAGLSAQLNSINASFDIIAKLEKFSIALIGDDPFITLVIDSVTFSSHNGNKPDCRLKLDTVIFGSQMQFVQDLADALDPSDGPFIELAADSIRAGFRFAIESMTLGAFNLMQLAIEVAVALPFDGTPVRCEFGLSDQQQPFLLSCGIYGGGGFLQLQLGLDGVQLLQGAFEFGVCADISIGPLTGSGYLVAGIYFRITANDSEVCGFVHSHGHMDIFGIISMDVDLYVAICYETGVGVFGIATFSVSVSIAFFSETFSMQAQYTFAGSGNQNQSNSMLEFDTPYRTAEAFLVAPDDDSTLEMAYLADPPKSKPGAVCPIKPLQNDIFVAPTMWKTYYNSFLN
jgi:hypothetical protein